MTITNMLLQKLPGMGDGVVNQPQNFTPPADKGESFDDYINNTKKLDPPKPKKDLLGKNHRILPVSRPSEGGEAAKAESVEKKTAEGQAVAESPEKTEAVTEKKPEAEQPKETENLNPEIISRLAQQLGISVEKIIEILTAINIEAVELTEPEKLNLFVQKLTGANDVVEMLTMPEVKEALTKANEIMAEFEDAAKLVLQMTNVKPEEEAPRAEVHAETAVAVVKTEAAEAKPENDIQPAEEVLVKEPEVKSVKAEQKTGGQKGQNLEKQEIRPEEVAADEKVQLMPEVNPAAAAAPEINTVKSEVTTESVRNINTRDVIEQIVSRIKVEVKSDVSEVRIHLKPEHLGEVQMKITTQNGIVTAQFVAESQRVKEVIESGFTNLKDTLSQQGINIQQLSVSVGNGENERLSERFLNESRRSAMRISRATAGNAGSQEELETEEPYEDVAQSGKVDVKV